MYQNTNEVPDIRLLTKIKDSQGRSFLVSPREHEGRFSLQDSTVYAQLFDQDNCPEIAEVLGSKRTDILNKYREQSN